MADRMTPVDELKNAALKLRKLVEGLPAHLLEPWRQILTDSEYQDGIGICQDHVLDECAACDNCVTIETWHPALAEYFASMQPAVLLAVAEHLDAVADIWRDVAEVKHYPVRKAIQDGALRVARALTDPARPDSAPEEAPRG